MTRPLWQACIRRRRPPGRSLGWGSLGRHRRPWMAVQPTAGLVFSVGMSSWRTTGLPKYKRVSRPDHIIWKVMDAPGTNSDLLPKSAAGQFDENARFAYVHPCQRAARSETMRRIHEHQGQVKCNSERFALRVSSALRRGSGPHFVGSIKEESDLPDRSGSNA